MKNKPLIISLIIFILLLAVVSVLASYDMSWYVHKDWSASDKVWSMSDKHSFMGSDYKSAWLEKVGLPEDASDAQILEFKKSLWEQKEGHMFSFKENHRFSFMNKEGFHKGSCGK